MDFDEDPRCRRLNDRPLREGGHYVLYWMQSAQRADDNPALHRAVLEANRLSLPVVVGFGLTDDYPEATERHYAFMLEGLAETAARLRERGVTFVLQRGHPPAVARELAKAAALVVVDMAYLRHLRAWRGELADALDVRLEQVEGEVVVPVESASDKAEYAARTLRPKINRQRDRFLKATPTLAPHATGDTLDLASDFDTDDPDATLAALAIDREVGRVERFRGGQSEARRRLTAFIRQHLDGYGDRRADPSKPGTSEISPYLHFGQIGVNEIAEKVLASASADDDKEAYLEELIVRRELAANFVWFTDDYDRFDCLPGWARKTLDEHRDDERPQRYTRGELEAAKTDDPYWNAAMNEMRKTGYMHNMMRMYWGKKVLEWCNTPEYAYDTLLYLNNRFFIDGRDHNSYANVGWIFGLHDRGWTERSVFGKVRYMNDRGLERKFDIQRYVDWVESI